MASKKKTINFPTRSQIKLNLSAQLNQLLQAKAEFYGVPISFFIKHLIIREVERDVMTPKQEFDWMSSILGHDALKE